MGGSSRARGHQRVFINWGFKEKGNRGKKKTLGCVPKASRSGGADDLRKNGGQGKMGT